MVDGGCGCGYDPAIARFTSADSVIDGQWDTQGWNRYSYGKGNPIRYKDPTGHHEYEGGIKGQVREKGEVPPIFNFQGSAIGYKYDSDGNPITEGGKIKLERIDLWKGDKDGPAYDSASDPEFHKVSIFEIDKNRVDEVETKNGKESKKTTMR